MSIYDVFSERKSRGQKEEFDVEAWAVKKQEHRQRAYDLIESTIKSMTENGDAFRQFLDAQAQFDRYSVSNAILVSAQFPAATQLKPFAEWRRNGVYVNRDAVKITILEPGKEYVRDDGRTGISCNAKIVYDISQTNARPAHTNEPDMRTLMRALLSAVPSHISFEAVDELNGVPAYYDKEQEVIFIQRGLGEMQVFTGVSQEIAAAIYDQRHKEEPDASTFKSYCVAYMLSKKYGMDTSDFNFSDIAGELKGLDVQKLKGELNLMRDVLVEIQNEIQWDLQKAQWKRDRDQAR